MNVTHVTLHLQFLLFNYICSHIFLVHIMILLPHVDITYVHQIFKFSISFQPNFKDLLMKKISKMDTFITHIFFFFFDRTHIFRYILELKNKCIENEVRPTIIIDKKNMQMRGNVC